MITGSDGMNSMTEIHDELKRIHGWDADITEHHPADQLTKEFRVYTKNDCAYFYAIPESALQIHGEKVIACLIERFRLKVSLP
jgi:hypothetical protein